MANREIRHRIEEGSFEFETGPASRQADARGNQRERTGWMVLDPPTSDVIADEDRHQNQIESFTTEGASRSEQVLGQALPAHP